MTTTLTMTHALCPFDMVRENTRDEIFEFITELDSTIAESDFTERLIMHLATSLAPDSKTSNMQEIGRKISLLTGYEP